MVFEGQHNFVDRFKTKIISFDEKKDVLARWCVAIRVPWIFEFAASHGCEIIELHARDELQKQTASKLENALLLLWASPFFRDFLVICLVDIYFWRKFVAVLLSSKLEE